MKKLILRHPKILLFLLILIGIRSFLPTIALRAVNWALTNKLGSYTGHVQDLDLQLYRGSYQLQNLQIRKKQGNVPPILEADPVDLQIAWRPLFKKEIAAHVIIDKGRIHLVDSNDVEKKQLKMLEEKPLSKGEAPTWKKTLDVIVPMHIESLILRDSAVYFTNVNLAKPIPVQLENIQFTAENLRTRPSTEITTLSPIYAEAIFQKHAPIKVQGRFDALALQTRVDIDFQLNDFDFRKLNSLLMAYVPIDVTKGVMNAYGEITMSKGQADGYVNVFLNDGDIIAPRQNFTSLKHFGFELLSAAGYWLLKNNETKKIATHLEFEKKNSEWDIDGSKAFWSALRNRSQDLKPGIENSISLRNLEGSEKPKALQ